MLHIHGLANTNIKVFTWKPHLFVAQSGKYHECQSWSDEGSCRLVCVTKKWLFLEDKSVDTDQLSSTIHVTESQIILAKKELWRWSFTSWSVWRGFGWSFQSHPDHRQGWQGRWGEGCQQEEPTSWDTRYIKIRFHLKLNDRLADNMVWENRVLDLAEKVFAPYQNVMDLWWTILIWMFVLSLRPNMFALARPLQDCEPLRQKMVCAHCAGSLEALFLRRCSFEALYHCLSKQSSAIFRVSFFLSPKAELHPLWKHVKKLKGEMRDYEQIHF